MNKFVKVKTMRLRDFGKDEAWLQKTIADNPTILGLGDVEVHREKSLPGGGRLDMLLLDSDNKHYEMEIQLGATDPSHIVRTVEYWDLERKRYPQHEHCAVIVAEDITSRFFNVIGLFNGHIPIIALKLTAIEQKGGIGLLFVKVLDEMVLTQEYRVPKTRKDWVNAFGEKSTKLTEIIFQSFGGRPYFTKFYAGGEFSSGKRTTKVKIHPNKNWVDLRFVMAQNERADKVAANLLDYRRESYWFRFADKAAFAKNKGTMKKIYRLAIGQEPDGASTTASESN